MSLQVISAAPITDCWNQIGVRGDRSCPELLKVVHCHNCPVFASASRRFLDAPSPEGYLAEWTDRLIAPIEETATDLESVLIFRLEEEWLALPVRVLVEVTIPRWIQRIPKREGSLAGIVNIRGELHLCIRLAQLLGIKPSEKRQQGATPSPGSQTGQPRWIVVEREGDHWVLPVDEVDQVYRISIAQMTSAPATLARSTARLTRGVFSWRDRSIGFLDEVRLFQLLRTRIQ